MRRLSASSASEVSPLTDTTDDAGLPIEEVVVIKQTADSATKISHSITERRYRENLNAKMIQLDQTLSLTRNHRHQAQSSEGQDEQSVEKPVKARKADIMNEAIRYVKQAEHERKARTKEIEVLRLRIAALEKLVNCGDCALLHQFAGQQMISPIDF